MKLKPCPSYEVIKNDNDAKDLRALSDRLQQQAFSWQHEDYFLLKRVLPGLIESKDQETDFPILKIVEEPLRAGAAIVWQDDA